MITVTYSVACDGPDVDDPDEYCEAEFEHTSSGVSDLTGLNRQVNLRGWTIQGGRFICPLHKRKSSLS